MSEKKEAKSAPAAKYVAPVKKAKVDPMIKIKRNADGTKIMKIARGTERARRRAGLREGWRKVSNAKQMIPTITEQAAKQLEAA